MGSRH